MPLQCSEFLWTQTYNLDDTSTSTVFVNNTFISYRPWRSVVFEPSKSFLIKVRPDLSLPERNFFHIFCFASAKDTTLIGRISDVVRPEREPDFVA